VEEDDPCGVGAPPLASRSGRAAGAIRAANPSVRRWVGFGGGLDLTLSAESVRCARQEAGRAGAIQLGSLSKRGFPIMKMTSKIMRMTKKVDRRVGKRK